MPDIFEERDKTLKMLIADDDLAIIRLLADRCVKMGSKVETATNGIRRCQSYRLETRNQILGPKLRRRPHMTQSGHAALQSQMGHSPQNQRRLTNTSRRLKGNATLHNHCITHDLNRVGLECAA
jgi:hypothetical protein